MKTHHQSLLKQPAFMKKIKYHAAKILPITLFLSLSSCHGTEDDLYPNNSERTDASRRMSVLEYPDIYEILKSEKVILEALNAWKEMLTYATHFSRREIGFFIYYRHSSNSYIIGEWVYGPLVPFTFGNEAYVNLGKPLFPYEVCAFYHCHPPYYGPDYRLTGASQEDENLAYKLDIPGFVFDYSYSSVWGTYDYETEADFPTTYVFGPRQRSPYKFY